MTWCGGWWTHNTIYRWCIIELYMFYRICTWILHNFINQCHPNKFNKKRRMSTKEKKEDLWFMERGQYININRTLEVDSNQHGWLWGVQDFSGGSNCRCGGNNKRTGIMSGACSVTEVLQSPDKTLTGEELLPTDEQSCFWRWKLFLVKMPWTLLKQKQRIWNITYI